MQSKCEPGSVPRQDLPSGDVGPVPRASQEVLDPGRALVEGLANCESAAAAASAGRVMAPVPPPPPMPASRTLSEEAARHFMSASSPPRCRRDSERTLGGQADEEWNGQEAGAQVSGPETRPEGASEVTNGSSEGSSKQVSPLLGAGRAGL